MKDPRVCDDKSLASGIPDAHGRLQPDNPLHVKIGVYQVRVDADDLPPFENHKIDDQTIDTRWLLSPSFIGDYNSITMAGDTIVAVYMGTSHPRVTPGDGPRIPLRPDETIFCTRILWE